MSREKVIQVDSEFVHLDVGLKSEGRISIDEFTELPVNGDSIQVVLEKLETPNGDVIVSKKKAEMKVFWKNLKSAFESQQPVDGKVIGSVKGGYEVSLGHDMKAFCPISKMDVQRIGNPENYIGLESPFIIDRLFSRKKSQYRSHSPTMAGKRKTRKILKLFLIQLV